LWIALVIILTLNKIKIFKLNPLSSSYTMESIAILKASDMAIIES